MDGTDRKVCGGESSKLHLFDFVNNSANLCYECLPFIKTSQKY